MWRARGGTCKGAAAVSHEATTWAIRQRGLSPAAKLVLWHLADRFHPDNGCFPRQKTLAEDCEMSRSSLNNHLDTLEKAGLIRRETRRDPVTKQQIQTRYRLACETGFGPAKMADTVADSSAETGVVHCENDATEGGDSAESRVQNLDTAFGEPSPKNGQSRVQLFGLGYKAEPVTEPVSEREGARAGLDRDFEGEAKAAGDGQTRDGRAQDEPTLDAFRAAYPPARYDGQADLVAAWEALPVSVQRAALAGVAGYLAGAGGLGRKRLPKAADYLTHRLWTGAEAAAGGAAALPAKAAAPARHMVERWSRPFWAVVLARLAAGQRPAMLWDMAVQGWGWGVPPDEPGLGLAEGLVSVSSQSAAGQAWQGWLARCHGLRVPWGRNETVWLWVPAGEAGDLSMFGGR